MRTGWRSVAHAQLCVYGDTRFLAVTYSSYPLVVNPPMEVRSHPMQSPTIHPCTPFPCSQIAFGHGDPRTGRQRESFRNSRADTVIDHGYHLHAVVTRWRSGLFERLCPSTASRRFVDIVVTEWGTRWCPSCTPSADFPLRRPPLCAYSVWEFRSFFAPSFAPLQQSMGDAGLADPRVRICT